MIRLSISVQPVDLAVELRAEIAGHHAGISLAPLHWGFYWRRLGPGEFLAALGPIGVFAVFGARTPEGGA